MADTTTIANSYLPPNEYAPFVRSGDIAARMFEGARDAILPLRKHFLFKLDEGTDAERVLSVSLQADEVGSPLDSWGQTAFVVDGIRFAFKLEA